MDLMPIARDIVMDKIPELVFVIDSYDRILDANSEAEKWLGVSRHEIIGHDPMDVFRKWPQLINRILSTEETREEVEIPGDIPRTLEIIVTPIHNELNILQGRVIVAYDITDRKLMEIKLKKANEELLAKITEAEALRAQLQEQAIRDPLTGVFNRRFLAKSLDKQVARARRDNTDISIVMIDLDHFKKINDTYGHKCGDVILQELSEFLVANSRGGDVVCRYGGEEFVILLPDATHEDAYERAETLRHTYEEKTIRFNGHDVRASFSAGVAGFPIHGKSAEAILQAADHALYQSKNAGRNRVTLYKY